MSEVNFSAILGKTVGTAPEPKPLPEGTYTGIISSLPQSRGQKTKDGMKGILSIQVSLTEAMDDVDQTALQECGGLLRPDGDAKTVRSDFWLTEDALYILDRFLAGFGFSEEAGKSYAEALEELPGKEVTLSIALREYTPPGGEARQVNDVKRIFAKE